MALGTVTRVAGADTTWGNKKVRVRDVQLTSGANYTTAGETITAAAVGMKKIEQAIATGVAQNAAGTLSRTIGFAYQTNGSVKMLVHTTASAEAASNSDQSTFSVRIQFIGY